MGGRDNVTWYLLFGFAVAFFILVFFDDPHKSLWQTGLEALTIAGFSVGLLKLGGLLP